jgi:hypothetical protein
VHGGGLDDGDQRFAGEVVDELEVDEADPA